MTNIRMSAVLKVIRNRDMTGFSRGGFNSVGNEEADSLATIYSRSTRETKSWFGSRPIENVLCFQVPSTETD